MQGAAGIAAFLLRFARVLDDGLSAAVVDRPDQWWTVPERLCVTRAGGQVPVGRRMIIDSWWRQSNIVWRPVALRSRSALLSDVDTRSSAAEPSTEQ
jgi:hypothetical protein